MARLGRGTLFVTCGAGPGQRQGGYVTPSQDLLARPQRGPRSTFFNRVLTGVGLESEDVRGCFGKLSVSTLRGYMGLGVGEQSVGHGSR